MSVFLDLLLIFLLKLPDNCSLTYIKMFLESQNASYFTEDVVKVTVIKRESCFSLFQVNLYFFFSSSFVGMKYYF